MRRTKIVIPFEDVSKSDIPIIRFNISDKDYYAIIDTGAESTIFDISMKKNMEEMHDEEISIIGVSGAKIQKTNIGNVRIWIRNALGQVLILKAHGYINDISHISNHFSSSTKKISAIFGSDLLNEFHAKLNFIKKEISFKL